MVRKKYTSKRTTLQDKAKAKKRCAEHHRKTRKMTRRDAKNGIVKHLAKKKDPGIPNSWPFKQELLNDIAQAKERQIGALEAKKNANRDRMRALGEHQKEGGTARTYEEMMAMSVQKQAKFDAAAPAAAQVAGTAVENAIPLGQQSRRAYLKELKKVVDNSDVVLQVLDARDPMGSRAGKAVEELLLSKSDKKMVLVLNKIDLVPKDAVRGWLTYLRRSHPTVALKAGTGSTKGDGSAGGSGNVGRAKGESALKSTSAVGVEGLLQLLKNYCRIMDKSKGSITVGVIGYPNVGKSSIINSLKRARAVGVSPRPGFTTSMQEVVLDKNIRLLDSPGVVFDDGHTDKNGSGDDAAAGVMLRNCVDADSVEDPIGAVKAILGKCTQRSLLQTYCLPMFPPGDEQVFLGMIAKKYGKITRGGLPNKTLAARTVLRDWNSGKVPFYTPPPSSEEMDDHKAGMQDSVQVVAKFGEEFDVSQLDVEILKELEDKDEMDFVHMESSTDDARNERLARALARGEEDDDSMQDDGESEDADDSEPEDMDDMDEGNVVVKKGRKGPTKIKAMVGNDQAADAEDFDFSAV
jgi:nuclear GTP-binding protein